MTDNQKRDSRREKAIKIAKEEVGVDISIRLGAEDTLRVIKAIERAIRETESAQPLVHMGVGEVIHPWNRVNVE